MEPKNERTVRIEQIPLGQETVKKNNNLCNLRFGHMNSTFVCYHHYNEENLVFPCADVTSRIQLIFSSKRNNNFQLFLGNVKWQVNGMPHHSNQEYNS